MRTFYGLALAGALLIGTAQNATAQLAITVGNPYAGQNVIIGGNPYAYGAFAPGYGGYAPLGYSSVYSSSYYNGYAPLTRVYSSGYAGYAPQVYAPVAPVYGYGGYRNYGYRRPYSPYMGVPVLRRW